MLPKVSRTIAEAAVAFLVLSTEAPAGAVTGATDTATPVYRTDQVASSANRFYCDSEDCVFTITTTVSGPSCRAEIIALAPGVPWQHYPDTRCHVSISGSFNDYPGAAQCVLLAPSLDVHFTSNANVLFDAWFSAQGSFKPVGFGTETEGGRYITRAQVTIGGSSTMYNKPFGTASIKGATFTVSFPFPGLRAVSTCYPKTVGGDGVVTAVVSGGTIVSAP